MVREGRWTEGRPALLKIPRLMGQTLGFISFGRVARAVAKRAAPFGLRMMAYDPFIAETLIPIMACSGDAVGGAPQSDFVSMHAPARPEVHHMLGEAHFRQMKPSAIFINTGRGATVNEKALIKALQEGRIAACRARRPGKGAAFAQQSDAGHGERHADGTRRLGLRPLRRNAQAPGRFRVVAVLSGMWPVAASTRRCWQSTSLRRWQPVGMERGPNS